MRLSAGEGVETPYRSRGPERALTPLVVVVSFLYPDVGRQTLFAHHSTRRLRRIEGSITILTLVRPSADTLVLVGEYCLEFLENAHRSTALGVSGLDVGKPWVALRRRSHENLQTVIGVVVTLRSRLQEGTLPFGRSVAGRTERDRFCGYRMTTGKRRDLGRRVSSPAENEGTVTVLRRDPLRYGRPVPSRPGRS